MRPGATPPSSATPPTTPRSGFSNKTDVRPQVPPARVHPLPWTPQAQPGSNSLPPTPQGHQTVQAPPEANAYTHPREWARFTRAMGSRLSGESLQKREAEFPAVFEQWQRAKTQKDRHAIFARFMQVGCTLDALETRIARSISKKRKRERQYLKKTEKEPRAVAAVRPQEHKGRSSSPSPTFTLTKTRASSRRTGTTTKTITNGSP